MDKMKAQALNRNLKTRTFKTLIVAFAILSSTLTQSWGQGQDCSAFGDAGSICAPISQVSQTLNDGTPVVVSNGASFLATSATTVKFVFTSSSANSGKNIFLQFFDISQGLTLTLPTPKCSSAQIPGNGCVTAVDSNGAVTVAVVISGATAGKVFKYQLNGPAGFTSGFVTTTFTSSGGGVSTPEACGGDVTRICAPITRLSATSAGKAIAVAYDEATQDGISTISPDTTSITYNFAFPSDYMNKYVFVQFFDITTLALVIPGGSTNSSTSCDPQPAAGGGCQLQVAADGKASFTAQLSNTSVGSNFKFKIAGPNYSSHFIQTTVALAPAPTAKPTMTITAGKGKFTLKINNAKGQNALVTYKVGKKLKTTTLRVNSDKALVNLAAPKGSYSVTMTIGKTSLTKKVTVS